MDEAVLVVGAGPSGISSAYYLEKAGISYRVVDRAEVIASTLANLYPSLRLNTAGFVSHLPGKHIPLRYGIYPMGRDFYRYITDYMRGRKFNIELGVDVRRVVPDGDLWRVETVNLKTGEAKTSYHQSVIIASGRFGNPYLPPISGNFQGRYLHAHHFHDASDFAGERVLVVGNGPTGVDIAAELTETAALPVLLAIRSDVVLSRRFAWGLPMALWLQISLRLPKKWRKPFMRRISYRRPRDFSDLGITIAPNRTDRVGTSAPVPERELVDNIRSGKIKPVKGLARLEGRCAFLADGSEYEVDSVIMSTGYRPALDYLDMEYAQDVDGWPVRVDPNLTEIAGYPGLYLVGRYYRGLGPLNNVREEARVTVDWIAARLRGEKRGKLRLPDVLE
jgi:putative flavoprotein involved in K+ transport